MNRIKFFGLISFLMIQTYAFADPLTTAIEKENIQEIKKIIRSNPSLVHGSSEKYKTPYLHLLANFSKQSKDENSYLEIIQFFLDYSADINFLDKNGESLLFVAFKNNDSKLINFLFQQGIKIISESEKKLNLHLKNNKGQGLLFFANRHHAELLFSKAYISESDLLETDHKGNSLLEQALMNQQKDLADLFLQKAFGSKIKTDKDELRYFTELFIKHNYVSGITYILKSPELIPIDLLERALELSLKSEKTQITDLIIEEIFNHPSQLKAKTELNLMQRLIEYNYDSGIKYLLKKGFDPNQEDERGRSLAHFIAQSAFIKDAVKVEKLHYFYTHYKLNLYKKNNYGHNCFDHLNVFSGLKLRFKIKDLLRSSERSRMFQLRNNRPFESWNRVKK